MKLSIILVTPARAENVGAAARAMKTMGLSSLRIVSSDAHLQPPARWVAHGSGDILDQAQAFSTLEEALVDVDFVIASTARSRAKFHHYCTPLDLLTQLEEKREWCQHAALVFGREDSGLTNEELELADLLTGIPMQADYPSLNLGQAVMVYCYQLSSLMEIQTKDTPAPAENQLVMLRQRVSQLLVNLSVENDHKLSDWIHERLGAVTQRDMAMLHTLLNDINKELNIKN